MKAEMRPFVFMLLATALFAAAPHASAQSVDDAWDVSNGIVVTDASATLLATTPPENIFGQVTAGDPFTLFGDMGPAGTIHFVEWEAPQPLAIGNFRLEAWHDQHDPPVSLTPTCPLPAPYQQRRDATHRGIDHFTLKAWNPATNAFDIVLYDQDIPLGDDDAVHPGEGARLYDPLGVRGPSKSVLVLDAAIPAVVATRWRAEFRQLGCHGGESGPRILELDGFASDAPLDTDSDGVPDEADLCPATVIPEAVPTQGLNPNHWALVDGDLDFDTVVKGKGKGPNRSYTTEDTGGCSCEQIIEAQGLGKGHRKHGCAIGEMDKWVKQVQAGFNQRMR